MMQRIEATALAVQLAGESPIIGGVGNSTFDLVPFDRPQNFYMWNSMGMASSIGLGLALARPDLRVVVLDGDGSLLMNLSSLATERSTGVRNLVHVVWDNGGWEITGGQPAGSPFGVDLEAVARGCGFLKTATVDSVEAFGVAFAEAMADDQNAWALVAKVGPGDSPHRPSKNCVWLRDRFKTSLSVPGDGLG
ncbi:MAG TPA: thiamine pyrophosphate-dependent enzyme [Chloroflexota bacterium]|jgi:thiamine pyrophosphate-dependent acetolactate synthase large subunit-like protein|nr:thiamine pyrophosphate-dependent enzyme [Chloroflexota bacterium]